MGTELNLDLWGHRLAVRTLESGAALLRTALQTHVVTDVAPVALVAHAPNSADGLHTLLDRSGLVLARSRTPQEIHAVLAEFLTSFAPPPVATIRVRMRAMVRGAGASRVATLAVFPLLALPPLVERQLARRSLRVLDRLAVDITQDLRLLLTTMPWPEMRVSDPVGHVGGAEVSDVPIGRVLVPVSPNSNVTKTTLVCGLANTMEYPSPTIALNVAERLSALVRYAAVGNGVPLSLDHIA